MYRIARVETGDAGKTREIVSHFGGRMEGEGCVILPKTTDVAGLVKGLVEGGVEVREVALEEEGLEELYLRVSHENGTEARA